MRAIIAVLLILPALAGAQRVSPDDLLKEDVAAANERISYGPNDLNVGELRLPATSNGRHPVVMLVHGGCWLNQIGKMDPRATSLDLLRPMAASLTAAGYATWNVEYRRLGNPGGGWPGTFEDLSKATDFLRSLAPKHNLDLARVLIAGHSSGGHLAMWIAARPRLPASSPLYAKNPLPVRAVMNLDGPADPAAIQPLETKLCGRAVVTEFMGGTPAEQPDRYRDGSPLPFLPLGVLQDFVAGGLIQNQIEQITAYQSAARAKGDTVTITVLDKAGHFDMLQPRSPYWTTVEDRIRALLR